MASISLPGRAHARGREKERQSERERVKRGEREVRNKGGRNNVSRDVVFLLRVSGVKMQEPFLDYALLLSCDY